MISQLPTVLPMLSSLRWVAHEGHLAVPAWVTALRREVVAAFRRGSMSAERCLSTYFNQGARDMLPYEAVVFLATQVVIEREGWGRGQQGDANFLAHCGVDRERLEHYMESGRAFFFPVGAGQEVW